MTINPLRRTAFLVFACVVALGGCADGNLVKDLAQGAGIGGEPKPAPDFITRTRAPSYEYQPIGQSAPKRRLKAKDGTGVTNVEAEMDSLRANNEARGSAARQAGATMPVAAPPAPRPAAPPE